MPILPRDWSAFLREMHLNHRETGALLPSSRHLARLIVQTAGASGRSRILEVGAGTGVFTAEILRQASPGAELLVVEKNPVFAGMLRERFPGVSVFESCASRIGEALEARNLPGVDCVVSGLPWAAMSPEVQDALLSSITSVLAAGGVFVTFAYFGPHALPAGARFRKRLREFFPHVSRSRVEVRNVPPAFVYLASNSPQTFGMSSGS